MSMFKVFKHSRERVFTLYCLYNTRRRIARAPHRCSPFDVRRLEKIDTPISEWYIARWWGFSFADGLQFLDCWFFSSPVSFSRFVLNVIQLFAPIIFTWFSLIFNDSCVFILFKSLPYCKRVFSQEFLRWTELNWTTVTTTNAMEPPEDVIVYILFSLMKACKVGMLYLYRAQSEISLAFLEN